jgi:hypothetical protein
MVLLVTWAKQRSQLADILHLKPAIAFIAVLGSFDVDPLILLSPPSPLCSSSFFQYSQEMLNGAQLLGIAGLIELCEKKLGEFDSRVRTTYIRWEEVVKRNGIGGSLVPNLPTEKGHKETLLLIGGAVFDVTRW